MSRLAQTKSSRANEREILKGLGVVARGKKILIFYNLFKGNRCSFKAATSDIEKFDFRLYPRNPVLKDQKGRLVKTERGCDFRIAKLNGRYFLTYKEQIRKQIYLSSATSEDLIHWKKIGKIFVLDEAGMIVPNYKYQGKYVLYFGEKSIRITTSDDLETWEMPSPPIFQLPEGFADDFGIKIGNLIVANEGILLIYYLFREENGGNHYSIKATLFDNKNPKKRLWKFDKTIWEQTEEWKDQQISPIGIIKLGDKLISYWQDEDGKIFALSHFYSKSILQEPKRSFIFPILKKFSSNPILRPIADHFWESQLVFNPAAVYEAGKVHLLYRAVGESGVSVLGYASSKDGVHIDERLKKPIYVPREPFESNPQAPKVCFVAYMSGGGCGGCEDPKITKVNDRFYMTYVAWNGRNPPRIALTSISADDFLAHRWKWERPVLISPPGVVDKSCVILPEKINGKYIIFHRIFPNILIDFVDDLNFDGKTKWLRDKFAIKPRKNMWDSRKISAGATPIKTDDGWLLIYHGVGNQDSSRYKIGAMLLDLKDPTRVLFRTDKPILEPTERYENEGHKFGIVYPSGAVTIKDKLFVYYGGADTVCCVATANLNTFLDQLKHSQALKLQPAIVS